MHDESHPHAVHPAATPAEPGPEPGTGPGYEVRDTKVEGIVAFIVGLFIALTVTQFAMWWLLNAISGGKPAPADEMTAPEVAVRQFEKLRRDEDAVLGGYGWADAAKKKDGPVRIPIDRAIDLLADQGIPPLPGPARTEVEVNSHSGTPAPAGEARKDRPDPERRGEPEKGARP